MDEEQDKMVMAEQDLSDEFQIKFAISNFYSIATEINENNAQDYIMKLKAHRNVIKNMMYVYLAKFNNQVILDDFVKELEKAKTETIKDGKINRYEWYFNEMKVIGTFLGIRENIAEKGAEQLLNAMIEEEKDNEG